MAKFISKRVKIEAVQFDGKNHFEIGKFAGHDARDVDGELMIQTLEGELHASPGDWIIKGLENEFYPCKPSVFAAKYDALEE